MNVVLVDTHCHLYMRQFDSDRDAIVQRALDAGVTRIVVPGLDVKTSEAAIALAGRYEAVYAAVGVHPNDIGPAPPPLDETIAAIRDLARHPKVVAIGEIGLDYYRDTTPEPIQHVWLDRQLALATELELPVILHNRKSTPDILAKLTAWCERGLPATIASRPGVMHSFSATWEEAQEMLRLGFYIGFAGPITFRNAVELQQAGAHVPADRIVIETDAPFQTPEPHRGKRNEPAYVIHVAEKLAQLQGADRAAFAEQTSHNAATLFGW